MELGKTWLRSVLIAISVTGVLIFSLMFASSFADKTVLEKAAIIAIQKKVQTEVKSKYPSLKTEGFLESAEVLRDKFGNEGKAIQIALDAKIDVAVATVISRYCGCETVSPERQNAVTRFFKKKGAKAEAISGQLESFIKGKYDATVAGLIQDIRIFSAVNVGAFTLVFLLALTKPTARFHLLLPASLLTVSAILTILLYVFGQNWFYTLMLGNFWGFAYLIFMGVVLAFVVDITLLGGTITGVILSPFTVLSPC